ncbi:MAG: LysR family transcriptional regulator [Sphingobium sp.]|nr:LysR family transcriptional regulator [Sphingobium sp.]
MPDRLGFQRDAELVYAVRAEPTDRNFGSVPPLEDSFDATLEEALDGAKPRYSRFKMRQLALVLKLVGTGNLHEAASALNMSQPAATKLLQEIEEALGAVLFIRQSRGMKPTPAGIMAARHAGFILAELRKMQQDIDGLQNGVAGYVHVGAIISAVPSPVAQALSRMAEAYPAVEVSLNVGTSDVLLPELDAGRLDFVVGSIAGASGAERLTYSPLIDEVAVVVAGSTNPILRQHNLTLKDIFSERWILPPAGAPELRSVEAAFNAAGLPLPANSTRMASMIATATVVGATDTLAIVPESMYRYFAKYQAMGKVDVKLQAPVEAHGLIYVTNRRLTPAARALYDFIKEAGNDLSGLDR